MTSNGYLTRAMGIGLSGKDLPQTQFRSAGKRPAGAALSLSGGWVRKPPLPSLKIEPQFIAAGKAAVAHRRMLDEEAAIKELTRTLGYLMPRVRAGFLRTEDVQREVFQLSHMTRSFERRYGRAPR